MDTVTLVNRRRRRRRHSRRRNPSLGSVKSIWNEGTRPMTVPALAGGLLGGWAATGVPNIAGMDAGYKGIAAAGATAILGTVLVGRVISKEAGVGFGIVAGTIVLNRLIRNVMGMGVPYLSDGISNISGRLGLGGDFFGQEEEIFGVQNVGALEPTYQGWGTFP